MAVGNLVKRLQDIMRKDAGINGDAQRIEQMVWMFFLKVYDAAEEDWELDEDEDFKSIIPESLRWRNWAPSKDEEGKLKKGPVSINCLASDLYGADRHGDAIVGNVMIVRAEDERLTLLTKDEADVLATGMEAKRDQAVEKISAAFGLKPIVKPELEIVDLSRRQSCRKNGMER